MFYFLLSLEQVSTTPYECYNDGLISANPGKLCHCDDNFARGEFCEESVIPHYVDPTLYCANNGTLLNWLEGMEQANDTAIIGALNGTSNEICSCSQPYYYGPNCQFIDITMLEIDNSYIPVCYFGKLALNSNKQWYCQCFNDYTGAK